MRKPWYQAVQLVSAAGFKLHCVTPEPTTLNHFPDLNKATSAQDRDLNKWKEEMTSLLGDLEKKRAREAYAEDHPNAFKHFKRSESTFVLGLKRHPSKLWVLSSTRQPSRLGAESAAAWHSPRGLPGAISLPGTRSCGGIQCYCRVWVIIIRWGNGQLHLTCPRELNGLKCTVSPFHRPHFSSHRRFNISQHHKKKGEYSTMRDFERTREKPQSRNFHYSLLLSGFYF